MHPGKAQQGRTAVVSEAPRKGREPQVRRGPTRETMASGNASEYMPAVYNPLVDIIDVECRSRILTLHEMYTTLFETIVYV